MDLSKFKPGDTVTITYGYSIYNAKVLKNFPEDRMILLKFGSWLWPNKIVFNYDAHNFKHSKYYL